MAPSVNVIFSAISLIRPTWAIAHIICRISKYNAPPAAAAVLPRRLMLLLLVLRLEENWKINRKLSAFLESSLAGLAGSLGGSWMLLCTLSGSYSSGERRLKKSPRNGSSYFRVFFTNLLSWWGGEADDWEIYNLLIYVLSCWGWPSAWWQGNFKGRRRRRRVHQVDLFACVTITKQQPELRRRKTL